MSQLEDLQSLYDQNRFLEAFRQSADYWKSPANLDPFSSDELILGARLASRLGGSRLSRWLYLAAGERDPSSPRVRYFASRLRHRRRSFLDEIREREVNPTLDTEDLELQSSWLAWNALIWSALRDFERAHESIERARALYTKDGWVSSCESQVLGSEDRWEEALKAAELSWELNPGAPFGARSLGASLLNLGRVEEAARRLGSAAEVSESHEVVVAAFWHQAAFAETLEGEERRRAVARARDLAERIPSLAPLADREFRSLLAHIRLDVAQLSDDHAEMERWASEVHAPFFQRVLENLKKNPQGARIRLPYRREMQKHMTCLPASIASSLAGLGVDIDANVMAAEVTYDGTSEWAAADWLEARGLAVRSFVAVPELAESLIRNRIPFVISLEGEDFSHAVAVVGLDEGAGTLLLHDPNQFRTFEVLMQGMARQAPFGPTGMAAVPVETRALLDELLPAAEVEVMAASRSYSRALQRHGPTVAGVFAHEIAKRHPSHPWTRLLQALTASEDGRTGEALAGFQELLDLCPAYAPLRARLINACRALGNTALLRETLESVVERGLLPGMRAEQEWQHPPSSCVSQYADLLRLSAATTDRARTMLHSVVRREPANADAWHVLGDLLWHEREVEGALLSYRIASCLSGSNEHYARAYADALGSTGHADEGLAWLERRVRFYGNSPRGSDTWSTWIGTLESWGRPERALAAGGEALEKHGSSAELLVFVVPFLARMGQWEQAAELLKRLEASGSPALYHPAAIGFHVMKGDLDGAIRHAEAWVREVPLHLGARNVLLDQIGARDGPRAALDRAAAWVRERPGNDGLEELYCDQLDRATETPWKKALLLRRRLKRNPEDGWAWRELALGYIRAYGSADARRRERFHPRIAALVGECERTAPENAATFRVKADWFEAKGEWRDAVALWLDSVDREPETLDGYRWAWECSATFASEERLQVWQRMESMLLNYPGRLHAAREVIRLAAQRFGVTFAEQAVSRWKGSRPSDPELTEAEADLLLDYGHGRSDAERALAILKPAVEKFPFHLGLRFSLIAAYRGLGNLTEAEEAAREVMRRHPSNPGGPIQLALILELADRTDEARSVLESAIQRAPQNPELSHYLVQILLRSGRLEEAHGVVSSTLERLPRSVFWRERAIQSFLDCGNEKEAIAAARDGVVLFPRGSYLWYLLGETLDRLRHFAAQGDIERCYRRSLELNQSFFDVADRLAMLLVSQRRFDEAEKVIREMESRHGDPCPARGRLAWIHRQQGQKREALEEMASVLKDAPWYQWGWNVLMAWLAEDKAWDRAKSLLGTVPPEIRTHRQLLKDRLRLLESAGLGQNELDAEWDQILRDFPEDVSLHLERYDSLRDAKRIPEAAAVLRKVQPLDPDDPFMNARLVEALAREHKSKEAVDALRRVFFAPVERSEWPAAFAWETARNAGFAEEAFDSVTRAMKEGARSTPKALSLWAFHALERANPEVEHPQPLWRTWFPSSGIRDVLGALDAPSIDEHHRAGVLTVLSDFGYYALVTRYWREHRADVEKGPHSLAQATRALIELGHKRQARELMADWPDRPGVEMWMIANYVECFSGIFPAHLREIRASSARALSALPHDNSARYLAHVLAEACALLDDKEGFLATCTEHRAYFDGAVSEGEWFKSDRRNLLDDILELEKQLEQNERFHRTTLWRLKRGHLYRAILSSLPARAARRIPGVLWWLLFLGMVALLANL